MKFTHLWLLEHLDTDATPQDIAEKLTALGLEIEELRDLSAGLGSFTVAHIIDTAPHPNADKLQICRVKTHSGERQIVCGAPNARAGINVILADIGDIIPTNGMKIKPAKIRDVESAGMLCSASELGLGSDHSGIMELPSDANVGDKAVAVLGLNDMLYDIAITPNRGDCLGVYGVARDLSASGIGVLKPHKTVPEIIVDDTLSVAIDTDSCKHFVAIRIDNVTNGTSPEWLQRKLTAIGVKPISTLVDITNYFTFTYGRPLHVFDADKIHGSITVRDANAGEMLTALNDTEYSLPEGLCMVADASTVQAIAGVIGGASSGVDNDTNSVILESAWFDPLAVAQSGRILQIDTDARYRFERYVDPATTLPCAIMAAHMMTELCGGTVSACSEAGNAPIATNSIHFPASYTTTRSGLDVAMETQHDILHRLGCNIDGVNITTPSWRPDLEGPADLCEEIIRVVGYDALPETALPTPRVIPHTRNGADLVRSALLSRGLDETVHFAFTNIDYADAFADNDTLVHVANPISVELGVMRPHLLCDILPVIKRNHDRGHTDLALFETGCVFSGVSPDQQTLQTVAARTGNVNSMHWSNTAQICDIYDAKADLYAMLEALLIPTASLMISRDVPPWYHPGKSGRVSLGPKNILGYFGELHPAIMRLFDLDYPVYVSECHAPALAKVISAKRPKAFIANDYQTSTRDFAFIADSTMLASTLQQSIARADKKLIRKVTCFDVYDGEHMEQGKKSLAFSVTLQAQDRTLTEDDISTVSNAIIAAAQKQGAQLR